MAGQQDFAAQSEQGTGKSGSSDQDATAIFLDAIYRPAPDAKIVRTAFQAEKAQGKGAEVLRPQDVANMNSVERIKLLADDAKKGAWSDNAKVIWAQIFKEARESMPGASIANINSELLVRTVREINKQSMKDDGKHFVQSLSANGKNELGQAIKTFSLSN